MMRLVERYEGPLRIESGFVDDTDAHAFAPMMIRAAVVAGVAVGAAAFAVWRIPSPPDQPRRDERRGLGWVRCAVRR
jgi:hypothetical protein